ncbi:lysine biosynthesis protein LysW [Plantactinospora sp. B6F1]|uniref:lysine biosynthesis protein LysW n=1 Tax=Plantactinospora sp. B6F1 TaxID=3158971 RepID=UPI0032D8BA84
MARTTCPTCESDIVLQDSVVPNEIVECAECRSELEVLSVAPLVLAQAPEIEEDWGE